MQGARAAKEVRAEVEPVRAPRLGAHPAAHAVGGLKHEDLAVPERPPGSQAGDTAAHDHGLVASLGHGLLPWYYAHGSHPAARLPCLTVPTGPP